MPPTTTQPDKIKMYYDILGLKPGSTEDEVNRAYRQKALKWHPDKNQASNAGVMFDYYTKAKEYLLEALKTSSTNYFDTFQPPTSKPTTQQSSQNGGDTSWFSYSRKTTNQKPSASSNPKTGSGGDDKTKTQTTYIYPTDNRNRDNSSANEQQQAWPKSASIYLLCQVTLNEILHGTEVQIPFTRVNISKREEIVLIVPIMKGQQENTNLYYAGEGNKEFLKEQGDIVVTVRSAPHHDFTRINAHDLLYHYDVNFLSIVIAPIKEIDVPTLSGKLMKLPINDLISPDTEINLPGQGLPYVNFPKMRGDIVVRFNLLYPAHFKRNIRKQYAKKWIFENEDQNGKENGTPNI